MRSVSACAGMTFRANDTDQDIADLTELRLAFFGLGLSIHSERLLYADEARQVVERLFLEPPLDMEGTFVGGMITARIHLVFESGDTIDFDIYNDRLAVDRQSHNGYY